MRAMPKNENQERYDDILNRIARRRPFGSKPRADRPLTPQDRALDLINAYDSLASLTSLEYPDILCYGPKVLRRSAWSAVVVWYHRKGYHGYLQLDLLGVWAHHREQDLLLTIGCRRLPYRAPVFDAGVYHVAIRNEFTLYYEDDGRVPAERDSTFYRAKFRPKDRLTHRGALVDILDNWKRDKGAG
jgi:hypothetical protein